jgi:predicted site-specific integrase-resolvase
MYADPEKAAKHYNVTQTTLRRWDNNGKIKTIRTKGNHRRYYIPKDNTNGQKIIYARVSFKKQESNLQNQIKYLKKLYPKYELVSDIGSGINFKRTGFKRILVSKATLQKVN